MPTPRYPLGMLAPDLRRTLVLAIDVLRDARDPWWIIASAAVALHGARQIEVGDVDLLLSIRDARTLVDRLGIRPMTDAGTPKFRSSVFARWTAPPLTVEIMANFRVATPDGWVTVEPATRMPVEIDGRIAYVPDRHDLAKMLRLFGRPKDLARVRLMALPPAPPRRRPGHNWQG